MDIKKHISTGQLYFLCISSEVVTLFPITALIGAARDFPKKAGFAPND
jgi:hypothetical protein